MSLQFFNDILRKNICENVERMLQPEISPVGVEQIKPGVESVQVDNELNTFTKAEQTKKTEMKINTLQIGSTTTREMKPFPRKSSVEENHYKVFEKYFEQNCTIENLNTENENLQIENQQLKVTNNELKEENIRLTREIEKLKAEVVKKDETIRLSTEINGPTPHQLNTNGKITKDGNKGNKKDKEKDKTPSTNLDNKMDPYFPYPMIHPFAALQISGHPPLCARDSFESHPSLPCLFGGVNEMQIKIDDPTPHQLNTDSKITRGGNKGNKKDKEKDKISSTNIHKRGNSSLPRSNQWHCKYCTYFNDQQENICTMCGRSKNKGAEATPMKTGGKVCSHCTLVNDSKAKQCAACDHRLDGCST